MTAALVGIVALVLLITQFSLHPFLALTIGSLLVAAVAGMSMGDAVAAFSDGFGSTAASVGTLIALGAMFGKLLADSGGADRLVDTIVSRSGRGPCRGRWPPSGHWSACRCSSRSVWSS